MDPQPPVPSAVPPARRWALAGGIAAVALAAVLAVGAVLAGAARARGVLPASARGGWPIAVDIDGDRAGPAGRFGHVAGTVTAVTGSSVTIRRFDGSSTTVAVNSGTQYTRDTARAAKADVRTGDRVVVRLADPRAARPTAEAVRIVLPSLVGTVSDLRDGSFTLTDRAGFRHKVTTTSSTTYTKDGERADRSALANGAVVLAVGTVGANGTDLTATRVATGLRAGGCRDHSGTGSGSGSGSTFRRDGGSGPGPASPAPDQTPATSDPPSTLDA